MNYITNQTATKEFWEESLQQFPESNFLQSWNWGVFQENLGKKVIRLVVEQDIGTNKVVGLIQLVREEAKRGKYLTIAGGPIFNWDNKGLFDFIFSEIKRVGKDEQVDFIRFRPQELQTLELANRVAKIGAKEAQMHLTADLTLQLDLNLTEEELLAQMRKNHRSAIRKAEKLGITVTQSSDPTEIKEFYDHQLVLANKHGFVPFSYKFFHEQFKAFVLDNQVLLFHAYQNGKLLTSAFVIFYNNEAVYHYGISTEDNGKLPGSYACQWAAIKEAKKRGLSNYNFWGIAPQTAKDHRFAGVTLFKKGFGGEEVEYLHAHDIPLTSMYYLTTVFEFIRKKLRRL